MNLLRIFGFIILILIGSSAKSQSYFTNGSAKSVGNQCYELTKAAGNQNGSVWYANQLDLSKPFDLEFTLNFGDKDGGADGIVFVLQTVGTSALGANGGGLGFEGFSPSLGIEFDDWQNTNYGDLSQDHIGVFKNGSVDHTSSKALAGPVTALTNGGNIEDGKDHPVRIIWNPEIMELRISFECQPRISTKIDLVKDIFGGKTMVYWGFTSATGGANNRQVACLRDDIIIKDNYKICDGQSVKLNARTSKNDSYKWFPATGLSNSSIKNPICSISKDITYTVTFKDICNNDVVDTVEVFVSPKITIDLGNDSLLCDGATVNLSFDTKVYEAIKWENGTTSFNRTLSNAGTYIVEAKNGACEAKDTLKLTSSYTPILSISGDSSFCEGKSVTLVVDVKPLENKFQWNDGTSNYSKEVRFSGRYSVSAENICGSSHVEKTVTELVIDPFALGNDTTICGGDTLFIMVPVNGPYTYSWSHGGNEQSTIITKAGNYTFKVSREQCSKSDVIAVETLESPKILLPKDVLLCHNEELSLDPQVISAKVIWNNAASQPTYDLFEYEGLLTVKAQNKCGRDSQNINVTLVECYCDVFFPNAISINDDGLNEAFGPVLNCQKVLYYQLCVYNRWGQLMFETNDFQKFWNAHYLDKKVQSGAYAWVVNYTGMVGGQPKRHIQYGTLNVLD